MRDTGSKIHRAWMCPASAILPHSTNEDTEARYEPARNRGTAIHKYLERVKAVGAEQALAEVPADLQLLCRALDLDKLPAHLSTEVAFAWNWRTNTARELGRNLGHRDYDSLGVDWDCEVPATTDVAGVEVRKIRRGLVGDYKSGWTRYPRPARFGQILIAAACLRYIESLDEVVGQVIYIDEDGESFVQSDTIDSWALDTFEREIATMMEGRPTLRDYYAKAGAGALSYVEGPHCDHCGVFKACNAKTALIRSAPQELIRIGARQKNGELIVAPVVTGKDKDGKDVTELQLQIEPGAITVRNAAAVYEACERIEAMCRRMRAEVCGIAYHEPIELSDGRVIERHVWKRRQVDGRIAAVVCEKHYGRDRVLEKLDIKLPLGAIEALVRENVDWTQKPRPVVSSKKGTGILDRLLDEIEAAKGLALATGETCEPRQPRKAK
jgi:hypothetical protein